MIVRIFPKQTELAGKMALSKSTRFYFEDIIDFTLSNQGGIERASIGKPIVPIV